VTQKVNTWLLVVIVGLLGIIVGMLMDGREVVAQGDGAAAHIVGLVGEKEGNEQAVYLIDAREQTLLVYEYGLGRSGLNLVAARNFQYDKLLEDWDTTKGDQPPDVETVRRSAKKRRRR